MINTNIQSEQAYKNGYEAGYNKGLEEGYEQGYNDCIINHKEEFIEESLNEKDI